MVLTADYSFLSYYPYFGFQGLTSHYANPLAQFDKRAAAIKSWSKVKAPDQFIHALDTLSWAPPTVFLMRHGGSAGESSTYTLRLAEDVYPNQPLHGGTERRGVRRPTVHRHHRRAVRLGHPQTRTAPLMATKAARVEQLPSRSVSDAGTKYRAARIVAVVAGLLGALLALATPLLPVKQTTAQLNWPQNGVLGSVEAPLIGYVATDLNISVPCQAAAGLERPGETDRRRCRSRLRPSLSA